MNAAGEQTTAEVAAVPEGPGLARRVASGAIWGQVARLAEVGLALALAVIFVRALGPALYGEYTFIVSAALFGAVILSFGQSEAFGRFVPEMWSAGALSGLRFMVRLMLSVRLLGLAVGSGLVLLLGKPVGEMLGLPLLGEYASAIAILLAGQVLVEVATGIAYARLHSRAVAIARIVGQVAAIGAFVVWTALGWADPISAALASTLSYFLSTAILFVVDLGPLAVGGESRPVSMQPIIGFALAAWGVNFFTFALAGQIDVLLIGGLGKGAVEIALYSVGTLVFLKLGVLLSGWANTAVASFAEVRAKRGSEWAASLFGLYLRVHLLLALLVYPPVILLSGPVTKIAFGADYAAASGLMSLFGLFWLASSFFFAGVPLALLLAIGRQRDAMLVRAVAGAINIGLDLVLIPPLGALGAIIATGVANVLAFGADFILAAREVGVHYPWGYALRVTAASIAALVPMAVTAPLWAQDGGNLVVSVLSGIAYCVIFAGMLLILKPLSEGDLSLLGRVSPGVARLFSARRGEHASN